MMKKIFIRVFYNKCPNCKKRGIFFLKINTRGSSTSKCKCCGKKYFVHSMLAIIVIVIAVIVFNVIFRLVFSDLYNTIQCKTLFYVVSVILLYLGYYFAPLEDIDDEK